MGYLLLTVVTLAAVAVNVKAVAPTEEAIKKWKEEGVWEQKIANWKRFKAAGGCAPVKKPVFDKEKFRRGLSLGEQVTDTVYVIVILVDFSDWPYTNGVAGTPADFDSILFSNRDIDSIFNPTGSMTDYYLENSYGQFYIKGDIYGWYRMPQTYDYYVGNDDGMTGGRILATHAVDAAENDGVDFSKYDHDNDGKCDGVIIIHAGRGAEEGVYGIWSHKWDLSSPRNYDGVLISSYTMNPEEYRSSLSPIGVFCHEYGHFLGLPDLYDVDYNPGSSGLGYWSLMAAGNQRGDSKKPTHLDAWSKSRVGFLDLIEVNSNIFQAEIPAVEYNPVAYKLQNFYSGPEYWVVENRQQVGFDIQLPANGLLIYHVDTLAPVGNTNPNRYYVALEQADGNNDLALHGSKGDGGDPWRAPAYTDFHTFSNPNSRTNVGVNITKIGVWDISVSDSIMYADLDVTYSRPWIEWYGTTPYVFADDPPGGNGDGILDAGDTIQFYFTIINKMRGSYNVRASLSTNNPSVDFITNDISLGVDLTNDPVNNAGMPIVFALSSSLESTVDTFYLTITTDSLPDSPGGNEFSKTFAIEVTLGAPQILLVDDDRGTDYETRYLDAFTRLGKPPDLWSVSDSGSPSGIALLNYQVVVWFTGDSTSGVLDSNKIAAMKEYLDGGGSLLLSTTSGVLDFNAIDTAFLTNYLHATYAGTTSFPFWGFAGISGSQVGDGTKYYKTDWDPWYKQILVEPVNGGAAAFAMGNDSGQICGVTYNGAYKTILLTFPIEFIDDAGGAPDALPKDTLIARALKFFGGTSVHDGQPFGQLPQSFVLDQNYPNPFNPVTIITYTLRTAGEVGAPLPRTNLSIYNVLGQKVKTLVDQVQIPGTYEVTWDGTDRLGRPVASGIYFYRLERGNDSQTKKMILVK
jgi:immune inhibitor A